MDAPDLSRENNMSDEIIEFMRYWGAKKVLFLDPAIYRVFYYFLTDDNREVGSWSYLAGINTSTAGRKWSEHTVDQYTSIVIGDFEHVN